MRTLFDSFTLGHDNDVIGISNRRESVSDDDHGSTLGNVVESLLHDLFGVGVEGAGSFVEHEDFGVGDDAASNDHSLLLSTG